MNIVGILGSPSATSRSATLLAHAQQSLRPVAACQHTVAVRELPAEALLHARVDDPQIAAAVKAVADADLVLVATPIYKAAYSGLLKAFLDLLSQDALRGKTVLPLATGGSIAHLLALDYALKPVLSALGARDILDPVFATDPHIPKLETGGYTVGPEVQERVTRTLEAVIARHEALVHAREAARQAAEAVTRQAPHSAPWAPRDVRWST